MWEAYLQQQISKCRTEIEDLKIDVQGISDLQEPRSGKRTTNSGPLYYWSSNDTTHSDDITILVAKKIKNCVVNFTPHYDRIMTL